MRRYILWLSLLFFSPFSFADTNPVDDLIHVFHTATSRWEPIILSYSWSLFAGLVILSFTWNAIQILLKQGGVIDAIVLLAQSAMTIGVSVYILQNASYLAWSFINSLSQIAGKLSDSSTPFSPSDIFNLGLKLASKLTDNIGSWHVGDAFVMGLSAIVVLVIFAMITAEMTVLLVGSFVIVSGGTVMLAFLGSQWTRDYGMNYLTCIIGIGLQLFVMQLMVILGHDVFVQFAKTGANNSATSLITVGLVIVYYALIRTVPNMASSLATGNFRFGSGHAIAAAGTILGAAAGAGLLASSAGASATSTSLSKFVGSAAGQSVANTLQKGGEAIANHSPLGKGAIQGAKFGGEMAKGAASVGGKTIRAGMEALAQQSPVGRALAEAAKHSAAKGHAPQKGGHQKVVSGMAQQKAQTRTSPDFSPLSPDASHNNVASESTSSVFDHAQRELVERLKEMK